MSLIDYESIASMTDKRIVKSRRSIFDSLLSLLAETPLSAITVTQLCKHAMLNRKTFYSQYSSVESAFEDLQCHLIGGLLARMRQTGVLSPVTFHPTEFIYLVDTIRQENKEAFDILYPYIRSGSFMGLFGTYIGLLGNRYVLEGRKNAYFPYYSACLVFTLSGILNSYFDWLDHGQQLSLEEMASLAGVITTTPLVDALTRKA